MSPTQAYNVGYTDGKAGDFYNLDSSWTYEDVRWYKDGWRRGSIVRISLKGKLYQKGLFDE